MSDFWGSGGGGECDLVYEVFTMFAVLTLPVDDELVFVVVVGGEALLGMTETPRVKFAESLLLSGVETRASLIETRETRETRSSDEVREHLCELIMS